MPSIRGRSLHSPERCFFYAQGRTSADRRATTAVANYYTLFHLGLFLVYSCPKYQNNELRRTIQERLNRGGKSAKKTWTNHPGFGVDHGPVGTFLRRCEQSGLPNSFVNAFDGAQKLREFINYGPRVDWRDLRIFVYTREHSTSEIARLQHDMENHFHNSIAWACREGQDNGIWVPNAIRDIEGYFTGPTRHYGDWCTDAEAQAAESLRASLHEEAHRAVFRKHRSTIAGKEERGA